LRLSQPERRILFPGDVRLFMLRLYVLLAAYQTACCSTLSPSKKLAHSVFTRSALHFGTMPNGVKKENLPSKMCVTCNRPFTWRKKWERCWDEVSTCSKGCNAKRRALAKASGQTVSDDEEEGEEEDVTLKTAGAKKVTLKMDMIVKNAAIVDGDDSDDNEDSGVQAKNTMKSEKKLSRKKLQKLRMMQIPTEENNSKEADGDDDVSEDDNVEAEEDAEEEEEEERTGNAKKDKRLSKELLKLNMKISSVETSSVKKNSALKIDTDDDNNDHSGGEGANEGDNGDEGDDEGEVKDTIEPIKTEKKLSRKKLQKLKLKEAQRAEPVKDGPTERTKACAVCKENMTLLFRCQWDASKQWRFVCKFISLKIIFPSQYSKKKIVMYPCCNFKNFLKFYK
jgi:hypothetical protein